MTLTPAYGRDYTRQADVLADFNTGRDFIMHMPPALGGSGRLINKDQIPSGTHVQFRYAKQRKVLGYQVK
jgi:hypothetical protein